MVPSNKDIIFDFSPSQQAIYFSYLRNKANVGYNIPLTLDIIGKLNIFKLEKAINTIADLYPILKAKVLISEDAKNYIQISNGYFYLEKVAITSQEDVDDWLKNKLLSPFDLHEDLLVKFFLVKITNEYHKLFILYHHIIIDDLPNFFIEELFNCYYNRKNLKLNLENISSYYQFLSDQALYLESEQAKIDLKFFQSKLDKFKGSVFSYEINYDFIQTKSEILFSKQKLNIVEKKLIEIKSQSLLTSSFSIYLAAFYLALSQHFKFRSFLVRTILSQRHYYNCAHVVGEFSNTVVVDSPPFSIDKNIFIRSVWNNLMDVMEHGRLPYSMLIKNNSSLLDSIANQPAIVYHYIESLNLASSDLSVTIDLSVLQLTQNPIMIEIFHGPSEVNLVLRVSSKYFSQEFCDFFLERYRKILKFLVENEDNSISWLKCLSQPEIIDPKAVKIFCDPKRKRGYFSVLNRFESLVQENSNSIAIEYMGHILSYADLNISANQLAHFILKTSQLDSSVVKNKGVLIFLKKDPEAIVAMLATIKLGAYYIPVNVSTPIERLAYIIGDSDPLLVLTQSQVISDEYRNLFGKKILLIDKVSDDNSLSSENLNTVIKPKQIMYLVYTSGTTGVPKGVFIQHEGVLNLCFEQSNFFGISKGTKVLQFAPLAFDASVSEIWVTLLSCGVLNIPDPALKLIGSNLISIIKSSKINVLTLPPSILSSIPPQKFSSLKTLVLAGELSTQSLIDSWLDKVPFLINAYGPSEVTVCATMNLYKKGDSFRNIGYPIKSKTTYVFNENMQECAVGSVGELYLGGIGLSVGYTSSKLTAEQFVKNPLNAKEKIYRTGDRVKKLANGSLEFWGRNDSQVKIRGFRVELEEIKQVINKIEGVFQSIVVLDPLSDTPRLLAFLKLVDFENLSSNQKEDILVTIKRKLTHKLPDYMLPSAYYFVENFPLSVNGKIDKQALYNFQEVREVVTNNVFGKFVNEDDQLTRQFIKICCDVLKFTGDTQSFVLSNDFFDIGANSLDVLTLIDSIQRTFNVKISIDEVFENSSLNNIIKLIKSRISGKLVLNNKNSLFNSDRYLAFKFSNLSELPNNLARPKSILLTGATGFLGIHLLDRLSHIGEIEINCLVRAESKQLALEKIINTSNFYGLLIDFSRVKIYLSDISLPELGLSNIDFDELAKKVDFIFHCAAYVNHLYSYELLRAANVGSVIELLKFSVKYRLKKLHYISTIDTLQGSNISLNSEIEPNNSFNIDFGYAQTKWIAEKIISQTNVPAIVYRPGNIMGNSVNGACPLEKNHALSLLSGCYDIGAVPDFGGSIEMAPVNSVASAIVGIAFRNESNHSNKTFFYNLDNPVSITWRDYINLWEQAGLALNLISYEDWIADFLPIITEKNALFPFKTFYEKNKLELFSTSSQSIQRDKSVELLSALDIQYPSDYAILINKYFSYLKKNSFFKNY